MSDQHSTDPLLLAERPSTTRHVVQAPPPWGTLAVIDLRDCVMQAISDRSTIEAFIAAVVPSIGMVAHGDIMVERFGTGDLAGWSAMQFIETSSITVHADEPGGRCFVDVFSCKPFDAATAVEIALRYFGGRATVRVIDR